MRVKVASVEHLTLLFLESFRPADKVRIVKLLETAGMDRVSGLLEKFDDEKGTLAKRLQTLL